MPSNPLVRSSLTSSLTCDVLLKIFSHLDYVHIQKLSMIDKSLAAILSDDSVWRYLVCQRFGRKYILSHPRQIYEEKSRLILAGVTDLMPEPESVVQLKRKVDQDKSYLVLDTAFKFKLIGVIDGIPQGEYDIVWKLKFTRGSFYLTYITFRGEIEGLQSSGNDHQLNQTDLEQCEGEEWFNLVHPQPIQVTQDWQSCKLTVSSNEQIWKKGLMIESVQLKPKKLTY
ncbi:hypothetical protein K7432_007593 [Basidiobolus ranarum]|uniref:F-box domain-containing protein n=1 Tax=Basidiobolus ranarum TaxID=34480 RepID=A0ABR2WT68_9FUNG